MCESNKRQWDSNQKSIPHLKSFKFSLIKRKKNHTHFARPSTLQPQVRPSGPKASGNRSPWQTAGLQVYSHGGGSQACLFSFEPGWGGGHKEEVLNLLPWNTEGSSQNTHLLNYLLYQDFGMKLEGITDAMKQAPTLKNSSSRLSTLVYPEGCYKAFMNILFPPTHTNLMSVICNIYVVLGKWWRK